MDLPLSFYTVTMFAILLTGISKSGFGGGLGVMAVPMMSLFVAPQFAAAVLMPILLVMDILIISRYRKDWNPLVLRALVPGAFAGLTIGMATFQWMDANMIRFAVGLLAVIFVVQFLLRNRRPNSKAQSGFLTSSVLSAISGFASFVAHAGGPPIKGYLLSQNLGKTAFVGTNTAFFFMLNAIKAVIYGALGTLSQESLTVSLMVAPVLFLGVVIGTTLHHYIDQKRFVQIVYVFLSFTAVRLLYDSVPTLLG